MDKKIELFLVILLLAGVIIYAIQNPFEVLALVAWFCIIADILDYFS